MPLLAELEHNCLEASSYTHCAPNGAVRPLSLALNTSRPASTVRNLDFGPRTSFGFRVSGLRISAAHAASRPSSRPEANPEALRRLDQYLAQQVFHADRLGLVQPPGQRQRHHISDRGGREEDR